MKRLFAISLVAATLAPGIGWAQGGVPPLLTPAPPVVVPPPPVAPAPVPSVVTPLPAPSYGVPSNINSGPVIGGGISPAVRSGYPPRKRHRIKRRHRHSSEILFVARG